MYRLGSGMSSEAIAQLRNKSGSIKGEKYLDSFYKHYTRCVIASFSPGPTARIGELKAIPIVTAPDELAQLKKDALWKQLDIRREILKEAIIAKTLLKEMKNKPAMLKAILESDKRFDPLASESCDNEKAQSSKNCQMPSN
ncbi:hypothetical protein K438DRAFT_1787306 [Mycena galopus ATCC 62051]|nr:hypothetical protein K438DRAFT_1787306 [Mycena galopus ATCC 62051]